MDLIPRVILSYDDHRCELISCVNCLWVCVYVCIPDIILLSSNRNDSKRGDMPGDNFSQDRKTDAIEKNFAYSLKILDTHAPFLLVRYIILKALR